MLNELVFEFLDNAVDNGYGDTLDRACDKCLARELWDDDGYPGIIKGASLEDVVLAVKAWRLARQRPFIKPTKH